MPANKAPNSAPTDFALVLLEELEQIELRRDPPPGAAAPGVQALAAGCAETAAAIEEKSLQRYGETLERALLGHVQAAATHHAVHHRPQQARLMPVPADAGAPGQSAEQSVQEAKELARKSAHDRRERERKKRAAEATDRARVKAKYAEIQEKVEAFQQAVQAAREATGVQRQAKEADLQQTGPACLKAVHKHANDRELCGLALSGGGIRSATFCLGILQGLADLGLLKRFDYLSTVSGGGYIGSWLAAWIKRAGSVAAVEQQLHSSRVDQAKGRPVPVEQEPAPIFHLRSYSNYLAPRVGLMSADSWVLLSIYLRNFFLNQAVLLPTVLAALLLPRFGVLLYAWGPAEPVVAVAGVLAFLGVIVACVTILAAIHGLRTAGACAMPGVTGAPSHLHQTGMTTLQRYSLWPLVLASFFTFAAVAWSVLPLADAADAAQLAWRAELRGWLEARLCSYASAAFYVGLGTGCVFLVLHSFAALVLFNRQPQLAATADGRRPRTHLGWWVACGTFAGAAGGALLGVLVRFGLENVAHGTVDIADRAQEAALILTVGPPLGLLVFVIGAVVQVGLMGSSIAEGEREWWASLAAGVLRYAAGWAVFGGLALFSVPLLTWAGTIVQAALGAGWVVTTIGAIMAGRSPSTGAPGSSRPLDWLAKIGPPVFLAGLLVALSGLLSAWLDGPPDAALAAWLLVWLGIFLAVAAVAGWRVGVNTFSLQGLYDNRLTRAYLGASRPSKAMLPGESQAIQYRNPVTGFDPRDDLALASLRMGATDPTIKDDKPYWGPYLLVNTALNLAQSDELAWQERQAEAFVLSPLYCGSKSTGYRDAGQYAGGLAVGHAISVSGAAVSPNMGYHSSPAVTALLTVFNVRLGSWFGNPNQAKWQSTEPHTISMLFKELFGQTNRRSDYVYLSDGGHFENLGVYELVRRQCRFIVACDGAADPGYAFFDLGSLIRKCRSDLGVPIEIDVTPIKPQADGYSQWHCAIGKIRYDALDPEAVPGILVYVKTSLTGDEPSDVLNYAVENPPFPQQSTANQFFTESQFESYRALGNHVAEQVFGDAMRDVEPSDAMTAAVNARVVRRLFANLHRRWFPPIPKLEASFLQSVEDVIRMDTRLASVKDLRDFNADLYPEPAERSGDPQADPLTGAPAERAYAELYTVDQMLRIMERAWLGVHLEGYYGHPMNRGWMNVFRRWVSSATFRKHWLTVRGEFNQDFVRFCENELKLDRGLPWVYRLDTNDPSQQAGLAGLLREFHGEWPGEPPLHDQAQGAARGASGQPLVWLIAVASEADPLPTTWTAHKYVCGLVLVGPPSAGEAELLVWLRGPYRTLGIGRDSLDGLYPEILEEVQKLKATHLRVRYPSSSASPNADKIRKELWQNFFFQYGFRPAEGAGAAIVLTRKVP